MEKLLKFIVTSIVEKPRAVRIDTAENEGLTSLVLRVDPEDLKIVIGKRGKTIKALRSLLRLRALKENSRVNLTLQEE